MLAPTSDQILPDITDSKSALNEDILTEAQRRQQYRAKLTSHQRGKGYRLKQFVLAKRRYFRTLDLIARRKRAEDIDLMCRYFNGDQYGSYDEVGIYRDKRQEGDFAYCLPVLSGHVDQAFLQLLKVKPQYTATSDDTDDPTMKLIAQMCEDLGVKELNRVMESKAHSEIYNMILSGESHRFIGWQPNPISPKTSKRPKYEKKEVILPARRECANVECKSLVSQESSVCPTCNGSEISDIPAGKSIQNNLVGYSEVSLGENCVHIPHSLSMQRDMSAVEPEDSTFFIEYSYVDKHVAEWEYQSEIEPSNEGLPIEMQLRFDLERGSNQTDAIIGTSRLAPPGREGAFGTGYGGNTAAMNRKQPDECHYWEASEYGQFISDVDESLPDGSILPAGKLLGDHFPQGMKIRFVGDTIMEMRAYVRRRKHTLARYGRIAGTNSGAGLKKIMPLQDAENDNFNLNQTVKHTVGHPLTVLDGHYVNELPGAGNVLKVTRAGLDDVGKVVKQFPGQAVNQSDGAQVVIDSAMQFIAGTNTVGGGSIGGAADMRAAGGTATAVAAMQEQAAGRQSQAVDQRISCDKEMIIQLLENIQEYSTDEQKTELAKHYGPDVVSAFFQCNLRQSITISIKPNSDMPRSMALTQANYLAFGQAAAQVLPEAQESPWVLEFLGDLATSMGFPFSVVEGRNDRREAEYRLNILTMIETGMVQDQPQLTTNSVEFAAAMHEKLAQQCAPLIAADEDQEHPESAGTDQGAPRVFMQVHASFMDVYKDALFSERAKGWSDSYKLVVIQLWLDHFKAKLSQEATMSAMQAAMNNAMNPQPAPPESNEPSPEDMLALEEQKAQAEQQRALEMEGAKHMAAEDAADNDLDREKELETHKGKIQKDLIKAQPKPPARPASSGVRA